MAIQNFTEDHQRILGELDGALSASELIAALLVAAVSRAPLPAGLHRWVATELGPRALQKQLLLARDALRAARGVT